MELVIIYFQKWKKLKIILVNVLKKAQTLGYAEPGNPKL